VVRTAQEAKAEASWQSNFREASVDIGPGSVFDDLPHADLDASVTRTLVGSNTNAPTIVIAAADLIKAA
jgi:hypothetical protein